MLDAGLCRNVLISYGHNALSSDSMLAMLMDFAGDDAVFGHFGATGGYALAARRAMHEFNTGPQTWKHIAVGQRAWANLNPRAVMHGRPMSFDGYLSSKYVVEPLRLPDNCLVNDGGRAVVVTTLERARDLRHPPAVILGLGQHNPSVQVTQSGTLTGSTGARKACETALSMAGVTRDDVDACEIYDCFTYTVEVTMQDYGFFGPGEGEAWFSEGTIGPGGRMPVNTSGGQLSEAYYMGLTPLSEAAMQIMGRCGDRQLGPATYTREPNIVLVSDNGGILQAHSCCVLGRI